MADRKIFAGARVRAARTKAGLTQRELARRLEISVSYLNQIENNQRPLTASLMLTLAENFGLDLTELTSEGADRVLADLREAMADPLFGEAAPGLIELKSVAASAPDTARAMLRLYEAYRKANERLMGADAAMVGGPGPQTSYEEVRDFFHYANNYIDPLDLAAESLAGTIGLALHGRLERLANYLTTRHRISVVFEEPNSPEQLRRFERASRTIVLNGRLAPATQYFQLAVQLALIEQAGLIDEIVGRAEFKTRQAADICRLGLANYFAGALQMPYGAFLAAADRTGYDVEELAFEFGASMEQVGHRLSTMQRPKARGVPFFFARVDAAGTITKRHSATPLQFPRFGGACPLWNVHRVFGEHSGRIVRQLAETPDGSRYLCLAWSEEKHTGGFRGPVRRYAYALGCEITHAGKLTYAADLDLGRGFEPIGISCRICPRTNCIQRSVPPMDARLEIDVDRREVVPYRLG
ncbi:short-chain fatty acyl-CoA regulator family protein [Devosia sp. ZB163]|uniref:helix-turn-helix domain-containing protein n=1 Tax=Devosia sp. ZB163 TaxID=3025938 RepID=UPI00235F997B|nr:helix-turn-helix transcriptional regulator [Devosia sp. ZB163]MDC9823928.1 short-chain fatty acyl-CoA regulator family protein [Devosia sp. ZB163]